MKNKQGITIAALIIAIVGLSIGFAAFSNTLNISTNASVNPSDANFVVQFSKLSGSDATGDQNPITPDNALYGVNGLIPTSNKRTLTGLKATFTQPGQSVTYNLYVRNTGSYVAYLKDVTFANAANATAGETYKHCYAATKDSNSEDLSSGEMATGSLVTAACNGITISVTIGTSGAITPDSQSKSLGNQALAANGGYVAASVTISYANNASYVDGPMIVEFGDISFTASSNQAAVQQQSSPSSPSSLGFTGTIYRNNTDVLSTTLHPWCAVVSSMNINSCIYNQYNVNMAFSSEQECQTTIANVGSNPNATEQQKQFAQYAVCQEYTPSYETTKSNIDTPQYLKHTVVNDVITASYACFDYEENSETIEVCLQGGNSSYYGTYDGANSTGNMATLYSLNDIAECTFGESESECYYNKPGFLQLKARNTGYVFSYRNGGKLCSVNISNQSYCNS